ncbi:MAG: valine--tRNA ligase [Candidatus Colwellbacteria bacterium]|nr:valine--tRNA ligase [Candidatus Colwellbacteria bacterium]
MESRFDHRTIEPRIYRRWEKSGFFNPDKLPVRHKKPFTIMIAPPNVTGHLHVGHALENTLHDLLIRKRRMEGYKTLFLPGKDHAGIAAQYVVDRELRKEGKNRFSLGREKFLERMWQWMRENGDAIDKELKALGLSCDWSRKRFTMDPEYQKSVQAAFNHYYKKGWIYKGKRIVNWCVQCRTAISDLEVEYREEKNRLWYIRYPIKDSRKTITVATTRPETMLGDAAVAVHPKDKRWRALVGEAAILPIQNREIPIVADKEVDPDFGTGAVKVTPAHDLLDFEIASRHKLPFYQVISEEGRMTKEAGMSFEGKKVREAREVILDTLKKSGVLEKEEDYIHRVGRCERCGTTIEPLISDQWFLSMKELAPRAIKAAEKGQIKFHPTRQKQLFIKWLKQVKDWNISRQLWWGHKIPLKGVGDVLDTWFSSALWPFATLGWPEKTKDVKTFYPTNLISSAREIFYLWIVRMVFSGLEMTGKTPFEMIYTHPTILDAKGRKMSKSLGNIVDPMEMIDKYGTDGLRFGLIWQVAGTQDFSWDEGALVAGKKFTTKIWNASRFVISNYDEKLKARPKYTKTDRENLKKLQEVKKQITTDIEKFRFHHAGETLYHYFWHTFADKIIEQSKGRLRSDNLADKAATQAVLLEILRESLKMLHPFMPFVTEEIWSKLPASAKASAFGRRSRLRPTKSAGKAAKHNLLMIEKW